MTAAPALRSQPLTAADFHALVDRTARRLYRLAARLCANEHDAEDVLQEAYVRAFRAMGAPGFVTPDSIDAWLCGVVTNVSLNWLRDRKRSARREQAFIAPGIDAQAKAEARVALRELSALLEGLPAEQRAALVLKEFEGLSAKEVGVVLNISEGAVEQRLVRAREALRAKVNGD